MSKQTHKKKLMLDVDSDSIHPLNNLNQSPNNHCESDQNVINLTNRIEDLNKTVKTNCPLYINSVDTGSSGSIFESNHDTYIKISNLPYDSYVLRKSKKTGITCETIQHKMNVSLNEINNSLKYEELAKIFQHNIMRVISGSHCKRIYNDTHFVANKMVVEKVNGVTLDEALITNSMNEHELIICVLQLIYILTYANLNGYFHNDITCNNIMIYYIEQNKLNLDKLCLSDRMIECKFVPAKNMRKLPIVKLIDFSYSEYIDKQYLDDNNLVVIGEPQQILKMIRNKLRSNLDLSLFNTIHNYFNELNKHNFELQMQYLELDAGMTTGFRTLTREEIINLAMSKVFVDASLLNCFDRLKQFFSENTQYGISINISTILESGENNYEHSDIFRLFV